jgi:aminoglycoside/choline kinase family phosphotransferase
MLTREIQLLTWLRQSCGLMDFRLQVASDDASFRRYFRLHLPGGESLIAMDAPPDKEDCSAFIEVTARLRKTGVHVPDIHAQQIDQGFLLLEDLGETLYLDQLNPTTVHHLYDDAMQALLKIQAVGSTAGLPLYDQALLQREMDLFSDWLLDRHLGLALSEAEQALLSECFRLLVDHALQQPRVLVHRDYHSRNLLCSAENNPGIIDYQDAVSGPMTYDWVSLLKDCYIRWPLQQVDAWVKQFSDQARAMGLIDDEQRDQIPVWFDLMGVQRHLKAAGIFARLHHRDGKSRYLADIPRVLDYIVETGQRYQTLSALGDFIRLRVLPEI